MGYEEDEDNYEGCVIYQSTSCREVRYRCSDCGCLQRYIDLAPDLACYRARQLGWVYYPKRNIAWCPACAKELRRLFL